MVNKNSEIVKKINKPWGSEELLEVNDNYIIKRLVMNINHKCSLQYHKKKKETIYVIFGNLYIHLIGEIKVLKEGESITINPNTIHRMEAKDNSCIYLECSTPELDDVVRIEDDYNRK